MNERKKVIALGFFDGVHLGHGALLHKVTQVAAQRDAIPAVFTFATHPGSLIVGSPVPLINSPLDRADLMRRLYGIQEVIMAPFDHRMMRMPWQDFITEYLVKNHVCHVVAGHDFHFGYKGEGNPQRLKEKCAALGIGCDIIGRVEQDGITISSTYIRTLIAQGEMERANAFLGHPHVLTDVVSHGKRLGSTLGFPTVNLQFQPGVLIPAHGVYATQVYFGKGQRHLAVTNVGVRPTVDDSQRVTVEGYLLDFEGDLYGQTVRIDFHTFLRGEERFPSLDALRQAILHNVEQTRAYFQKA